jgi:hypothetical protein
MSSVRTWVPPNASPQAAALWRQNPFARAADLVRMTEERADEYTVLLFDSFNVNELRAAVQGMYDVRPIVREKSMIDEFVIGKLALSVIRAHWSKIEFRLRRPGRILDILRRVDPAKAAVLSTPEGMTWLNWTCYVLDGMLAHYARPKGYQPMAPPPGKNPLQPIPSYAVVRQ